MCESVVLVQKLFHHLLKLILYNQYALEFFVFEDSIPDQEKLAEMEEAGIKRVVITIFAQSREEALPVLNKLAELNSSRRNDTD